jgi:multiple sugar transport system substrate-binding protein
MIFLSLHKRKILFTSLSVGILVCFLAGCALLDQFGPSSQATQSVLEPQEPATSPPVNDSPKATSNPTAQSNNLVIWLPPQFDPEDQTAAGSILKARLELFNNENPELNVAVRIKTVNGQGGLLDSLAAASAAAPAALPALILLSKSDFETAALKGLIFPVTSLTQTLKGDDWFAFAESLSTIQGVQYGIPLAGDPLVLAYDQHQIAFPPKTWQEMSQQSSIVTFPAADPASVLSMVMYQSSGGKFEDTDGKISLQADKLNLVYQIIYNGSFSGAFPYWIADFSTFDQSLNSFTEGYSGLTIVWASRVLRTPSENISIAPLPSFSSDLFTITDGWLLCLPNPTIEGSSDALKLAEYLMDPGFQQKWTEAAGLIPARRSVLANWSDQDLASTLFSIAESAQTLPENENVFRLGSILQESMTALIRQQTSPTQATDQTLQKILGQN